jgi:hypothetical protein
VSSSAKVRFFIELVFKKYRTLDGCVKEAGLLQAVGTKKEIYIILEKTQQIWERTTGQVLIMPLAAIVCGSE